ncbi:NAD-dependent epimerase/dehydratase family protein [Marinospirillum minutulum]|uniref:NAD-dependent epimerase/dehydratase family protein n=1 Tax=Marinospirillum minutulum TaxID=64974 RepID=UPI00047FBCF4|nr:NAD-dependent epimerase/dehydratase family protein [Marinospirillum minutulum]
MNIAILGATSQIAKDLIISFSESDSNYKLWMFSRSPVRVKEQFDALKKLIEYPNLSYEDFDNQDKYDVVINFVGVGDPAKAKSMGSRIFEITEIYDNLALDYLKVNPNCKYIFLSSGAVYGDNFDRPVDASSKSVVDINNLSAKDWYSIAKIYAEAKHRALSDFAITDIRVFNYFSHTQDVTAGFFITDAVMAINNKTTLKTAEYEMVRDYIAPYDFFNLVLCVILKDEKSNWAVDCYSKIPAKKSEILSVLQMEFGLNYEFVTGSGINATGMKLNYYSENKRASKIGYEPSLTSIESIVKEISFATN